MFNTLRSRRHARLSEQSIYLYSLESDQLIVILTGTDVPLSMTRAATGSSVYFSTISVSSTVEDKARQEMHWKDVIRHNQNLGNSGSAMHRVDFSVKTEIVNVIFLIGELLFAHSPVKLIVTSVSVW